MHFKAISIGYAVPRTAFDTRVHSLFPSAANLRPAGGSRLLTLVSAGEADLPQGIRLETPEGFSFENLQTGERAACREGILRFEHFPLTVDLRKAHRWKCDLPALAVDLAAPSTKKAWRSVWQALNARQTRTGVEIVAEDLLHPDKTRQPGGFIIPEGDVPPERNTCTCSRCKCPAGTKPAGQSAAGRKISDLVRDLIEAVRRNDPSAATAVAGLVGLGSGLTPSGDDLLVGFLAGLWCAAGGRQERVEFLSGLRRAVVRLSRRTNDISRTYLYHAARGQVASRLAALAGAVCRGERTDRLLEAAEAAMQVGHASGMEAVTGLLLGLSAWDESLTQEKVRTDGY